MIRKLENVGFTMMLFGQGSANMRTPKFGTAGFWLAAYEHMRKQSKDMEKRELQMRLANLYLSLLPYKAIRFGGVV